MKKFTCAFIVSFVFFSFTSNCMDCFRLTENFLNLSVITLEGSQSTLEISSMVEIKTMKDDAINFLATGEETESFVSFLSTLKETFPSLDSLSDQELALKVVTELN